MQNTSKYSITEWYFFYQGFVAYLTLLSTNLSPSSHTYLVTAKMEYVHGRKDVKKFLVDCTQYVVYFGIGKVELPARRFYT